MTGREQMFRRPLLALRSVGFTNLLWQMILDKIWAAQFSFHKHEMQAFWDTSFQSPLPEAQLLKSFLLGWSLGFSPLFGMLQTEISLQSFGWLITQPWFSVTLSKREFLADSSKFLITLSATDVTIPGSPQISIGTLHWDRTSARPVPSPPPSPVNGRPK